MDDRPNGSLLTQDQINRLIEARQMADEIERLELHRRLAAELRVRRWEGRWFKPIDLWHPGARFLLVLFLSTCIVVAGMTALLIIARQELSKVSETQSTDEQEPLQLMPQQASIVINSLLN